MDRSGHRRQLAAQKTAFVDGLDPKNRDARQVMALMRVFHELVEASRARGSVSSLMHAVFEHFSRTANALGTIEIACRRGCSHCCHMSWIEANAPELVYIAKSLPGH